MNARSQNSDAMSRHIEVSRIQSNSDTPPRSNVTDDRITIPGVYCPFPSAIHPKAYDFDRQTAEFLDESGLCNDQRERARLTTSLDGVAGRILPHGDDNVVQVCSDFIAWIFAFDDICDKPFPEAAAHSARAELIATMLRIQRAIEAPVEDCDDRYASSLQNIQNRLVEMAAPIHVERWTGALRGHFLAEAARLAMTAAGRIPSLDDYVFWRLDAAAAMATVTFVPIAMNIEMPPELWAERRIRSVTEMAATLSVWDSDIVSYAKESESVADGHNLVEVLRIARECSVEGALAAATAMRDRVMCRFLRLREELAADGNPSTAHYAQGLGHYVRGALEWARSTYRYRYFDDDQIALQDSRWSEAPSDDSSEPLPIPSIAWWWPRPGAFGSPARRSANIHLT